MKAIVLGLAIRWFKIQAAKAATVVLAPHYAKNEIRNIILRYWKRYGKLRPEVPSQDTVGGSLMVSLAAMSAAFYQELIERGASEEKATQLFYNIAWKVYRKMGRFSWWLAGLGNRGKYNRLSKATKLFRAFPFSSPSYLWKDLKAEKNIVGFDCLKCPVAEYFETKGLSKFCSTKNS